MSSTKETVAARPPAISLKLEDDHEDDALDVEESPMRDGRNENSLAYLCQRFCEMYRNHSDPINIDLAAKELGIQRRRMYEILNIIQSVGLVGRMRSSFYRWDGYDKMAVTLEKLKDEGMARLSVSNRANGSAGATATATPGCMSPEGQRRKAVATALGERFVQIFLCNEVPQPIILEDIMGLFASCMGVSATGGAAGALTNQTSCARRLYDIANVFCSIGLVRKTCAPATDNRRKKRLYVWTGPVVPSTTTPLRPQRLSVVAPSASPGSGSAKRVKRESGTSVDTPKSIQQRKKSRLLSGAGGLSLEESMRKAEEEEEKQTKEEPKVEHPVVVALRGSSASRTLVQPPPLGGAAGGSTPRASSAKLLASALSSALSSSSSSFASSSSSSSSFFNPPNAKDGGLSPFTTSGGVRLKPALVPPLALAPHAPCNCPHQSSSSSITDSESSPAELKSQIVQLQQQLADAKSREMELLARIDTQTQQINNLIDVTKVAAANSHHQQLSHARHANAFLLHAAGSSPLTTSLALSPFTDSHAKDAFSSLASPSPFGNNLFSTGLTGSAGGSRAGRPPVTRKARVGPQLVDLDDDFALLPATTSSSTSSSSSAKAAASYHLSPATTSIASTLLQSPVVGGGHRDKENQSQQQQQHARYLAHTPLPSPLRVLAIKNEALGMALPSTPPPRGNLEATAASSLLSLTPSQIPALSPSIGRMFARSSSDSDSDDEDFHVATSSLISKPKASVAGAVAAAPTCSSPAAPTVTVAAETLEEEDDEAVRANASSPEPRAVRVPSLAAPSSPSPSAKNAKTIVRLPSYSHKQPPPPSPSSLSSSVSTVSTVSATSAAPAVAPLSRVADCLSS